MTTMIWKNLNYTGQSTGQKTKTGARTAGIKQLKSSLSHTLRTVSKNDLEFNKDLSSENLIFFDGKYIKLDEVSIKEREDIAAAIYQPVQNNLKNEDTLRDLKRDFEIQSRKIKRMIKSEENQEITEMLKDILSTDIVIKPEQAGNLSEVINNSDLTRKNQKIKSINEFIEASNNLNTHKNIIKMNNETEFHCRSVSIRESFWKFPVNQDIDNVKPEDYMDIIKSFYEKYLPDHPVRLIVYHGDEVLQNKNENSVSNAGVHPHIFVDGKNKKTGKYDIIDSEYIIANKVLKSKYPNEPQLIRGDDQSAKRMGEVFQELIYLYVNKELKNRKYDITVKKLDKNEGSKVKNLLIKGDTSQPKVDRLYNLINHQKETVNNNKIAILKQKQSFNNNNKIIQKQKTEYSKYEKMLKVFKSAISNFSDYLNTRVNESLEKYVDNREKIKEMKEDDVFKYEDKKTIVDLLKNKEKLLDKTSVEIEILKRSGQRGKKPRP